MHLTHGAPVPVPVSESPVVPAPTPDRIWIVVSTGGHLAHILPNICRRNHSQLQMVLTGVWGRAGWRGERAHVNDDDDGCKDSLCNLNQQVDGDWVEGEFAVWALGHVHQDRRQAYEKAIPCHQPHLHDTALLDSTS